MLWCGHTYLDGIADVCVYNSECVNGELAEWKKKKVFTKNSKEKVADKRHEERWISEKGVESIVSLPPCGFIHGPMWKETILGSYMRGIITLSAMSVMNA